MSYLRAFGSYLPSRVVGNAELASSLACEQDWIFTMSGISERRYAQEGESVVDLAERAAADCLARTHTAAGEVGLVLLASGSSERRFPGPAAETAARLGIAGVPAIDVPMASAGSLFGLTLAAELAPRYGKTLLIAAEKMSAVMARPPLDKNTAILFGDGAGACLVDPQEGAARVIGSRLHSDGSFAANLRLEFDQPLIMDGRTVILQAARKVPSVIVEVLAADQRPVSAVGTFLMHQANQNLIARIAQALDVTPEKFYSNIGRYGNTSSASMLIAASEWTEQRGFQKDEAVMFAGFGAGFHWGALLAVGC
jgi:3-oxoacyl-[acyl-carrier-protein] synthase-3